MKQKGMMVGVVLISLLCVCRSYALPEKSNGEGIFSSLLQEYALQNLGLTSLSQGNILQTVVSMVGAKALQVFAKEFELKMKKDPCVVPEKLLELVKESNTRYQGTYSQFELEFKVSPRSADWDAQKPECKRVFEAYDHYSNPAFIAWIQQAPGYEEHIDSLRREIDRKNSKVRHRLKDVPGFDSHTEYWWTFGAIGSHKSHYGFHDFIRLEDERIKREKYIQAALVTLIVNQQEQSKEIQEPSPQKPPDEDKELHAVQERLAPHELPNLAYYSGALLSECITRSCGVENHGELPCDFELRLLRDISEYYALTNLLERD